MPTVTVRKFSRAKPDAPPQSLSPPVLERQMNGPAEEYEDDAADFGVDHVSDADEEDGFGATSAESGDEDDDDFLEGLSRSKFEKSQEELARTEETKKNAMQQAKEAAKVSAAAAREEKKRQEATDRELKNKIADLQKKAAARRPAAPRRPTAAASAAAEDDGSVFANEGSEILGREKRDLLAKIQQYKQLFSDKKEVKSFKVRKGASVLELKQAVEELATIVETGTVEGFLIDSVFAAVKMIEGVSSYTRYDIRGLADVLKMNPNFSSLCRQCFIKYGCYTATPPEFQLLIITSTSAWLVLQKNKNRKSMEELLAQPAAAPAPEKPEVTI